MGKCLGLILAVCLLAQPVSALEGAKDHAQTESSRESQGEQPDRRRLYLILGGTVLGVTGMWITLYRRGK